MYKKLSHISTAQPPSEASPLSYARIYYKRCKKNRRLIFVNFEHIFLSFIKIILQKVWCFGK